MKLQIRVLKLRNLSCISSVFHKNVINIGELKQFLTEGIECSVFDIIDIIINDENFELPIIIVEPHFNPTAFPVSKTDEATTRSSRARHGCPRGRG